MAEREVKIRFESITDPAIKEIGKLKKEVIGLGAALLGINSIRASVAAVGQFNDNLMRMKFSANLSNQEILKFKDGLYAASLQTGVSSEAMLKMGQDALTSSKDIGFVNKNLKLMGDISNVIGTSEGVGDWLAEINEKTKLSGKGLNDFALGLVSLSQQKGMKIAAKDFFPRAGDLIHQFSLIMPKASADQIHTMLAGAMFSDKPQIFMKAQRRLFQMMGSDKESQKIMALGFSGKQTVGVMDVISKIKKKFPKNEDAQINALSAIFKGAGLPLSKLLREVDVYDAAMKKANPADAAKQAEEASKSYAASMEKMKTAGLLVSDIVLSKPIKDFSAWLSKLVASGDLEKFKVWAQEMIPVALALGGAIAAWKLFKFAEKAIVKGGKGGLGIGALGSATNPMYVIVMGGGAGSGGVPGIPGKVGKGLGGLLTTGLGGSITAVALPVVGMIAAAYFAHNASMNRQLAEQAWEKDKNKGPGYSDVFGANKPKMSQADADMLKAAGITVSATLEISGEEVAAKLKNKEVKNNRGPAILIPAAYGYQG